MYVSDAIDRIEDVSSDFAPQAGIPTLLPDNLSDPHEAQNGRRPPTRYDSFAQAPRHLKCRSQWKRQCRNVKPGAHPAATIDAVDPHNDIGLYPESATDPYKPTPATRARWRFFDLFVKRTQGDRRIFWDKNKRNSTTGLLGDWTTHRDRLRDADIGKHINGKDVFGVRAASKDAFCHFFDIDLDCHAGADKDIFLKMFHALLCEFYGENAFHVEVADHHAQGAHLRQVFDRARTIQQMLSEVRQRLLKLESQHPEITKLAIENGFKSFSKLEVFPNPSAGVRLPLCGGRTVLLDKPLARVFNKRCGRGVADVVAFMCWVDDPQRAYMSVEDVMSYVSQRLSPLTTLSKGKDTSQAEATPKSDEEEERSTYYSVSDLCLTPPKPPPDGVFELAQRQLYPSLAEIAVKGLVPVDRLRFNGEVPESSALATICVSLAMALWHEELFHLPENERHHKITNLLVDWVFANHNGVCSRLNTEDTKSHADVIKQVHNCVTSASRAEDHHGFFAEVRRKKAEGLYKHEISLVKLLSQGRQGEREEGSIYYSVSDSPDDSPLPVPVLDVLKPFKPKTRYKPFLKFATRFLNYLKAHDGVAPLSQETGFTLLAYPNPNQFTKYRDLLVKAGVIVLAQESVAHWRPNTYALTSQARALFGLASRAISAKTRRVKYSNDEVIAALTGYPGFNLSPPPDFDPQEPPIFAAQARPEEKMPIRSSSPAGFV